MKKQTVEAEILKQAGLEELEKKKWLPYQLIRLVKLEPREPIKREAKLG